MQYCPKKVFHQFMQFVRKKFFISLCNMSEKSVLSIYAMNMSEKSVLSIYAIF